MNSHRAKLDRFLDVTNQIERMARTSGVPFDRRSLPGRKQDFLDLVARLSPTVRISFATFDRQYARESGLRWRQGSRPSDALPLLELFGMTVGP
ncbi:MAG: hypothetical protein IPI40_03365 [Betaproteobacteria bacterium]|nr:hypothetical protein [Betaproteobacteria bacterium]